MPNDDMWLYCSYLWPVILGTNDFIFVGNCTNVFNPIINITFPCYIISVKINNSPEILIVSLDRLLPVTMCEQQIK